MNTNSKWIEVSTNELRLACRRNEFNDKTFDSYRVQVKLGDKLVWHTIMDHREMDRILENLDQGSTFLVYVDHWTLVIC